MLTVLKFPLTQLMIGTIVAVGSSRVTEGEAIKATEKTPILVELFTSEGCSTCPPADQLLQALDAQPFAAVQLVVLAEHVDYWDQQGWRDAYSSSAFTARQNQYKEHLHFQEDYTPQMIIDGTHEFNGSDRTKVSNTLKLVSTDPKTPVRISALSVDHSQLKAHVESSAVDQLISGGRSIDVFAVIALNHAETDVKAGENHDKRLAHTSVAKSLTRVARLKPGEPLAKDISLSINSADPGNLRLVVFLQDGKTMKVFGAAMRLVE